MYVWRSCREGRGEAGAQLATAAVFPLGVEGGSAGAKKMKPRIGLNYGWELRATEKTEIEEEGGG